MFAQNKSVAANICRPYRFLGAKNLYVSLL